MQGALPMGRVNSTGDTVCKGRIGCTIHPSSTFQVHAPGYSLLLDLDFRVLFTCHNNAI